MHACGWFPESCGSGVADRLHEDAIMRNAMHVEANLWSLGNPRTDADSKYIVFVVIILVYPVLITWIVIFMAKVTELWNYAYVLRAS